MRSKLLLFWCVATFAILTGWTSCERVTFPEIEEGGESGHGEKPNVSPQDSIVIDHTGEGTVNAPARVADVLEKTDSFMAKLCWVTGYIVGFTEHSINNATFSTTGAVQSNVLIADLPWTVDAALCMPIELKKDKFKKSLSLAHAPNNLGKRIAFLGTVATYFRVAGLRDVQDFVWLKSENLTKPEEPQSPQEPQQPQEPQKPEETPNTQEPQKPENPNKPEEPQIPSIPEEPQKPENPNPNPEDELGDPLFVTINEWTAQWVDRKSALVIGARYVLGTCPDEAGVSFIAASNRLGLKVNNRSAITANGDVHHLVTQNGEAPAVFVLEQIGSYYAFRDEQTGGYLAYDLRGSGSSTTWLPLYTLKQEDIARRYACSFEIDPHAKNGQIKTHKEIKYSETSDRKCFLLYNSYSHNFKIHYFDEAIATCLYQIK